MPKPRQPLTAEQAGTLIALSAMLFGGFIYFYPPATAGFPINDGGLFHAMISAVQANGFLPPATVSYNGLTVPFVYPPLGFYLGALLSSVLRLDVVVILQWLPATVTTLTAACFYLTAREILPSPVEAGMAAFLYVTTPRSATWLIMGGGITRSLGQLFLLLTIASVHRLFATRDRRSLTASIIAGSLVVLSHPEAALHTAALCIVMWVMIGRTRKASLNALLVGAGVLAATSIWWLPMLQRHGLGPTVSAAGTGLHNALAFVYPLFMLFTEEPAMTLVAVLAVVGFFFEVASRRWLLPAWFLLPFLVEPRSAPTVAVISVAMLGARALHRVVFPAIAGAQAGDGDPRRAYIHSGTVKGALVYIEAFLLVMALYAGMQLARVHVSPSHRDAFAWISRNTDPDARFLLITGATELFCDPVQEWFPVLTGRVSATTIQGNEWLGRERFITQMVRLQQVQLCLDNSEAPACIADRAVAAGLSYDFLYVTRSGPWTRGCRAEDEQRIGDGLLAQLHQTNGYRTVYSTDAVEILAVTR